MKQLFSGIRQWTVQFCDPSKKGNKWGKPYDLPAYCLEAISRLQNREYRQNPVVWLCEYRNWSLERPRKPEFSGQSTGKEGAVQNKSSGNLQTGSPRVFCWVVIQLCLRKNHQCQGKNNQKCIHRTVPIAYTKLGIVNVPLIRMETPPKTQGIM